MNYPWELMALAALLMGNRLAVRLAEKRPAVFWGMQGLNAVGAVLVGWFGISGMENFPIANWMVVGLLGFHMVQNHSLRERIRLERRSEEQFRENLRKMRENQGES